MKKFGSFTEAEPGNAPAGFLCPVEFPQLLTVGEWTRDGRFIDADTFGTLELPRSIKLKTVDAPGHDGSIVAGRLDEVTVHDDGNVTGRGWLLNDEVGAKAAYLLSTQALRGNSADLSVAQKDILIEFKEYEGGAFGLEVTFNNAFLAATTLLTEPAFDNAGAVIPEGWEIPGFTESTDAVVASLDLAPEPETEHAFAFNVLAERPKLDHEAFEKPKVLTELAPIYVDEGDRVYGYVAGWNTEHASRPGVYPPRSHTNYAHFASKWVLTTEGRVPVGNLVIGGEHAGLRANPREAIDFYAATSEAWADVAIGEDDLGIWVAGVVRPGTSNEKVHAARASALSGDWRRIGAHLELIIALSVNAPGFPIPRPAAFAHEEDFILALTGAGVVAPRRPAPVDVPREITYLANRFAAEEARSIVESMTDL